MRNGKLHLRNPMRNHNKFGSDFCKWVYEHCTPDFYFGNIDGIAFKKSTNILRVFEWKHANETLTPGQRAIFPILDQMIQRAVDSGALAAGSGVYIIYGNPPFEKASVYRFGERNPTKMTAEELKRFVACKPKEEVSDIEVLDAEIALLDGGGREPMPLIRGRGPQAAPAGNASPICPGAPLSGGGLPTGRPPGQTRPRARPGPQEGGERNERRC